MQIIRDFSALLPKYKGAVVALGNFDGVHLGHRAILQNAVTLAKQYGAPAAVMTFEPHPREFFAKDGKKLRISSFHSKVKNFADMGIELLFLVRFNARFASLSPESFVADVLHRDLGAKHIVTGYNFAFGKNRGGNTAFLKAQAEHLDFGFTACGAVQDASGVTISSSAIREFLATGNVKKASALLGRPYSIDGRVRHGQKKGRELGFPTANLSLDKLFAPRYGIYAARFTVEGNPGRNYNGAANLGIRPTFDLTQPLLEVHGFDMDEQLYGRRIAVELVEFLRDEQRFDNVEALKSQIAKDCQQARSLL